MINHPNRSQHQIIIVRGLGHDDIYVTRSPKAAGQHLLENGYDADNASDALYFAESDQQYWHVERCNSIDEARERLNDLAPETYGDIDVARWVDGALAGV